MSRLRALVRFLYDFVVGDDPLVAAGVAAAIALTAVVSASGLDGFWLLPLAVVALLALSLRRAARRS